MPTHTANAVLHTGLDPEKQRAVLHTDGPLLIIAGPGSGKTRTLVERVANMLQAGVPANELLVATFTEKAAKELVTRISDRMIGLGFDVNLEEMFIGTLHGIFLRLLEEYREYSHLKRSYRMLDSFDNQFLVFSNFKRFSELDEFGSLIEPTGRTWDKSGSVLQFIAKVTEECIDPEQLLEDEEPAIRAIGRLVLEYRKLLEDENCLDFTSIQTELLRILETQPQVLAELQGKLRYVMVDEYQDTNTVQERILLLLNAQHRNFCVVGDDDQGLYRFRGATIRNILEFPKNFAPGECQVVRLNTNYRSHPGIIEFYNNWMAEEDWDGEAGVRFRYDKTIEPQPNKTFADYPSVIRLGVEGNPEDYYAEVLAFIRQMETEGTLEDYNQIAFLFRSVKHEHVIGLAQYLESNEVPVFSPRSALFFGREEIRLVIGALVFVFPNLFEQLVYREGAHVPIWEYLSECKRLFGDHLRQDPETNQTLLAWARHRAKQHLTMDGRTPYAFAALFYQLLEFPMFNRHLTPNLAGRKTDLRPVYNIGLFTQLLHKFEYLYNVSVFTPENQEKILRNFFNTYLNFLWDGGIAEFEDFDEHAPAGCVSFLTIHQAKGLEFPVVVVGSLAAVPRKNHDEIDLMLQQRYHSKPPFEPTDRIKHFDFRRLFYTAFSRPQNLLVLSAHQKPEARGLARTPSRYFSGHYYGLPDWRGVDLAAVPLETVRPPNLKRVYSFTSHILLYESCPLQYMYYKVFGFAEVRTGGVLGGLLLHQTIEDIHKAVLRKEEHLLTDDNVAGWFHTNYALLSKQQRAYLHRQQQESLLRQVMRYRDRHSGSWHHILAAEVDLSLVKPEFILKGTVDLIRGEEANTVELVDFKSGNKPDVNSPDPVTAKTVGQYRRQLEVYAHLVEQQTGQRVARLHLYYPKEENGNPYVTWPVSRTGAEATVAGFK